jgi:hypothetical protein
MNKDLDTAAIMSARPSQGKLFDVLPASSSYYNTTAPVSSSYYESRSEDWQRNYLAYMDDLDESRYEECEESEWEARERAERVWACCEADNVPRSVLVDSSPRPFVEVAQRRGETRETFFHRLKDAIYDVMKADPISQASSVIGDCEISERVWAMSGSDVQRIVKSKKNSDGTTDVEQTVIVRKRPPKPPVSKLKGYGDYSRYTDESVRAEKVGTNIGNTTKKTVTLEAFNKMKKELKDRRREADRLLKDIRVQAADDPFSLTGRSRYLRSILLPDEGPVSMPDNVIRLHNSKAETVTYNLTVGESGAGVFYLYPNHPTNLIGFHYIQDGAGVMMFDQALFTAQDLKDSYDFAKRTSQLLTFRSSTLPSGVYALNGTFNAVRIDGYITEIPGLNSPDLYNSILTNTVEPLDKVGNVLVGDGVAILSMMDSFDQPFTRLGDTSPYTITTGVYTANPPTIVDRSSDLQYSGVVRFANAAIPTAETVIAATTFNVDSTTGLDVRIDINGTNLTAPDVVFTCEVNLLDVHEAVTFTQEFSGEQVVQDANVSISFGGYINEMVMAQVPAGAIQITVTAQPGTALADTAVFTTGFAVQVPIGARSGVNGPINVITYQGVAPGSVITLSGWTNFDLVPNPALRQNMPVSYTNCDVGEVAWCKTVLGNRKKFELRSVWNLKDYQNSRHYLAEIADTQVHDRAAAYTFGDFISSMKSLFAPALKGAIQAGVSTLASHPFIGAAASGSAIRNVRAASGDPIQVKPLDIPMSRGFVGYAAGSQSYATRAYALDSGLNTDRVYAMDARDKVRNKKSRAIQVRDDRTVAFPVLTMRPGSNEATGAHLYAASSRDYAKFERTVKYHADGFYVQGLDRPQQDLHLNRNVYLFPINADKFALGKIVVERGPIVAGHSVDAAIWLVCNGDFKGLLPYAITGGIDGSHLIENEYFDTKQRFTNSHGILLAGNTPSADIIVEDLSTIRGAERGSSRLRSV